MTHEPGKRYPSSDLPCEEDMPVAIFIDDKAHNIFHDLGYARKTLAPRIQTQATWQRLQPFEMAEPAIYKPWWADDVVVCHHNTPYGKSYLVNYYVIAKANGFAWRDGPGRRTREDAIRLWNAVVDPNSHESERAWAREQMK